MGHQRLARAGIAALAAGLQAKARARGSLTAEFTDAARKAEREMRMRGCRVQCNDWLGRLAPRRFGYRATGPL